MRRFIIIVLGLVLLSACARQSQSPTAPATLSAAATIAPTQEPTHTLVPSTPTTAPTNTAVPTDLPTAAPTTPPAPTDIPPTVVAIQPTDVPPTQAPPSTNQPATHVFPVQPASGVSYGTCHHDYPASDMFTLAGSLFVAPTSGIVDWVTYRDVWDPAINDPATRGGLSVAIIGDDGVRYYGSHLSQIADGIAVGVRVEAGQTLGLTGNSGDAMSTPPHLHFGISHPTTSDDWATRRGEINPYPYLNQWRDGIDVTPDLNVVGGGAC